MKIIAFTGMPGAGKSEAVSVARAHAIPVFRMGDLVWDEVKRRGLDLVDATVGTIATEEREKHGPGIWASRTVEKIRSEVEAPVIVIDGVRNAAEATIFMDALGDDFTLVAITASPETRFRRMTARNRADEVASREQFEARDAREIGWGLDAIIAQAPVVIDNEKKTLDDFRRDIGRVLEG